MGRPRKTEGDRVVDRIKGSIVKRLGREDETGVLFEPHEVETFELIKATVDDIAILEEAWELEREAGRTMIRGSRGQDVLNPLVSEIRSQRAFLGQLVARIKVSSGSAGMSPSEIGRHAANKRHNPDPADIMAQAQERWAKKAR